MKYYLFPAIIFFSFNSCIVEMEEYTTYFEKQVVVNSLINPAEDFSCILVYTMIPSYTRAKCEGKGYWRATRGEKEKCDACMGTGKVPKGS